MTIVPLGYTHPSLNAMDEIIGGSPYGAGSVSRPDGARFVSAQEVEIGRTQGRRVAEITRALVVGRRMLTPAP
jgi:NAD(P)H dehydrogenase (quinone)